MSATTASLRHHPIAAVWRAPGSRARARSSAPHLRKSPAVAKNAFAGSGSAFGSVHRCNQFGFTGRYLDRETELWYFRARYYSGTLGRFIGRDPLGYVDGMGLYVAYFVPTRSDPSGLAIDGDRVPLPEQMIGGETREMIWLFKLDCDLCINKELKTACAKMVFVSSNLFIKSRYDRNSDRPEVRAANRHKFVNTEDIKEHEQRRIHIIIDMWNVTELVIKSVAENAPCEKFQDCIKRKESWAKWSNYDQRNAMIDKQNAWTEENYAPGVPRKEPIPHIDP